MLPRRNLPALACAVVVAACGLDVVGTTRAVDPSSDPSTPDGPSRRDAARGVVEPTPGSADASGGFLTLTSETIAGKVDLSAEGAIDWVHWGEDDRRNEKVGGVAIGEYRILPADLLAEYDDNNAVAFSWSGGTPESDQSGTTHYSYLNDRPGIVAVVPIAATTTTRTAHLYLGGKGTRIRFEASLTDGSAAAPRPIEIVNESTFLVRFVVTFAAASAGASLEVKGSILEKLTTDGSLRIAAVSLR